MNALALVPSDAGFESEGFTVRGRPSRWVLTLILSALAATLGAGGTAAHAAEDTVPGTVTAPSGSEPICGARARLEQTGDVWVTIWYDGPAALNGWTLTWTMPEWQRIGAIWNAALVSQTGGIVTTGNLAWNGYVAPGGSFLIGYVAAGIVPPSGFALNGVVCMA
jgi:hypothetical protein